MPTSKQARSAQNRQKDRLAVAAIEKHRLRRRRRITAGIVGAVLVVGLVAVAFEFNRSGNDNKVKVSSPPNANSNADNSTSTTGAAPTSARGKPCVAMKGTLPKGAPKVPIFPGKPPARLVTNDITPGTGAVVPKGAQLTVGYIGVSCSTGEIFDSSYSSGRPAQIGLDSVIPGWQRGIPGMRVGGTRLLVIPPELAYGAQGSPPKIAPDETLYFVVTVKKAERPPVTTTTGA
jgi:FKBP-type peptidyl-prolyl cis-trans isomerase